MILLCFLCGTFNIVYSVFVFSSIFIPSDKIRVIDGIIGLFLSAYYIWGIASFFDKRKIKNYIKAFLCYILLLVIILVIINIIMIIFDSNTLIGING
jgi:predicted PurR-regulated permease PerM